MKDALIGEVLSNRYQILERVGAGGMAVVYRGKDTLLGRPVAVKVLREEYTADEEFVDRFRLEAQTAASLAHPNVVTTYDVGQDGDVHFIVMELVEGENLKERIRREGRLELAQALSIGIQIARALAAAHRIGLVHRDIKPHNILITPDGTVKVTDFGIARAQSAAALTQTGMIIGSVHYFSPQHARGAGIDSASDLYSLGVVLYEMVTGTLPFDGETPVAVALKHLNEAPTPPAQLVDGISPDLNALILRLLAKEPSQRPKDADDVVWDLQQCAKRVPLNPSPKWDEEQTEADDATKLMPALRPSAPNGENDAINIAGDDEEVEGEPVATKKRRKGKGRRFAIVAVLVLSFMGGLIWAAQKLPELIFPQEVLVPDITGLELEAARSRLAERGLRLHPNVRDVYSREVPAGLVLRQEPVANHRVRMGREIQVTVSRGPEYVVVPELIGLSKVEAQLNITQQNLTVGDVTEEFQPDAAPNTVLDQDPPAGTRLEEGSAVDIIVARGSQSAPMVRVPDVRGLTLEEAQRRLSALGLIEGQLHGEPHPSAEPNRVIDQNPPPGEEVEVGYPYGLAYAVPPSSDQDVRIGSPPADVEERYWQRRILIAVPDGPPQEVVVLVTDDWGPRQVLREVHPGGSRFFHEITIRGERARIQVWMDGIPHMNEEIHRRDGG